VAAIEVEEVDCYLCGQRDERVLLTGRDRLGVEGEFTVVQCRRCELMYLNPRPTLVTLSRHYPEEYYDHFPFAIPKEILRGASLTHRLLRTLCLAGMRLRVSAIERVRPLDCRTQVLDVGCGAGFFLDALEHFKGIKGVGVELDEKTAAFCRDRVGLDVRTGTLAAQAFPDGRFDVVTMFHYFEHELAPLEVLLETRRVLKEDGVLAMELPDAGSPLFKMCKGWSRVWEIPRHVVHYTSKTLTAMLERGGFGVVAVGRHFPNAMSVRARPIARSG